MRQFVATAAVLILGVFFRQSALSHGSGDLVFQGEQLFNHQWRADDPLSPEGGDGLGPVFNARSCVECHHQGARGGAGGLDQNARMVSLETETVEMANGALPVVVRGIRDLPGINSVFGDRGTASLTLHHHATRPTYAVWRQRMESQQDGTQVGRLPGLGPRGAATIVRIRFSERNTPPLWGSGLIDQVRVETLREVAATQPRRSRGRITGRVATNVGRFGWRGQITTLREFVAGACANELGLQTKANPQPPLPTDTTYTNRGLDMTELQVDALAAFVAKLPPPKAVVPRSPDVLQQVNRGRKLFERLGCSVCHIPKLQHVANIYSDLLLHDMGPGLTDPVPASSAPLSAGFYYGGSVTPSTGGELAQEWRTPPLWGVGQTPPYLHDGRAATLAEAIALHGGEAQVSRRKFTTLRPRGQDDLVEYVRTLGVE